MRLPFAYTTDDGNTGFFELHGCALTWLCSLLCRCATAATTWRASHTRATPADGALRASTSRSVHSSSRWYPDRSVRRSMKVWTSTSWEQAHTDHMRQGKKEALDHASLGGDKCWRSGEANEATDHVDSSFATLPVVLHDRSTTHDAEPRPVEHGGGQRPAVGAHRGAHLGEGAAVQQCGARLHVVARVAGCGRRGNRGPEALPRSADPSQRCATSFKQRR